MAQTPALPDSMQTTVDRAATAEAIVKVLPKDAIVRSADDAVGRFAGERTLAIVTRTNDKVMLFRGSWGTLKRRLEEPDVEVTIESAGAGSTVTIKRRVDDSSPVTGLLGGFVTNSITLGLLIVLVTMYFLDREVNTLNTALIAVGGGAVWTFVDWKFGGPTNDIALAGLVVEALKPLAPESASSADTDADA